MGQGRKSGTGDADGDAGREPSQAERTRQDILEVATREFAEKGYSGARIDEIAALTSTTKRAIYYHYESKQGLFIAVLEKAYRGIRALEATLDLDHLEPVESIRTLVGFTFDYQWAHADFVRLVMVENIHHGAHLEAAVSLRNVNVPILDAVNRVYVRGVETGVFRRGIEPIDIHMTISALAFFNVSNRYTFSRIFDHDLGDPVIRAARRSVVIDTVLRFLLADTNAAR